MTRNRPFGTFGRFADRTRPLSVIGAVLIVIGGLLTGSGLRVFDMARPDREHRDAAGRPYP